MAKRRVHVWISGRVQGVFFRAYTRDEAHRLGLKGWVRNLRDGRVEAVFEGESEGIEAMLKWCRNGSPLSRVDHVQVNEEAVRDDFTHFEMQY